MDTQRLRNLTTGRLHTDISCLQKDLEELTGQPTIMTHMIPRTLRAIEPWLRKQVTDPRLWNGEYDPTHTGEYFLPSPTPQDRRTIINHYLTQPDPLEGKKVLTLP